MEAFLVIRRPCLQQGTGGATAVFKARVLVDLFEYLGLK